MNMFTALLIALFLMGLEGSSVSGKEPLSSWAQWLQKADQQLGQREFVTAKKSLASAWIAIPAGRDKKRQLDILRKRFVSLYLLEGDKIRAANAAVDGWNELLEPEMKLVAAGAKTDPISGQECNYFVFRKDRALEFHMGSPPCDPEVRILSPTSKEYKRYVDKVKPLTEGKKEPLIQLPDGWSYNPSKDRTTQEWRKKHL